METEKINLITQIILLITAIVGLFKTWQIGQSQSIKKHRSDDSSKASWRNSPIVMFAQVYGIVLIPIIFILIMTFLIKLTNSISNDGSATERISTIEVPQSATPAEVMLAAALQMQTSTGMKRELIKTISIALERREYEVAIKAASAIPFTTERERQLSRIAQAARSDTDQTSQN